MLEAILSDYFYSDEATAQFTFFKIPRQLITDPRFKRLSTDAKLLYSMLLDRVGLSSRNGWHDDTGRVYIYYTVKEICENIGCGRNKAIRLLAELDTAKGIGLIERVKQGRTKPDRIYVKRIDTQEDSEKSNPTDSSPTTPVSEVDFSDVQRSENPTSRGRENRPLEVSKEDPNKTNKNKTDISYINLSISPTPHEPTELEGIDRCGQRKVNIDFVHRAIYDPLSCWAFATRTSCFQTGPPGYNTPDSTVNSAVRASMSFVKHKRPLVRGKPPP